MAATFTLASIKISQGIQASVKNTGIDGSNSASVSLGVAQSPLVALTTGTGTNQANRLWQSTARSLNGTSESINLYSFAGIDIGGGVGNGPLGGAMALTSIVGIFAWIESGAGSLIFGGEGTANCWTAPFGGSNTATIGPFYAGCGWQIFNPSATIWAVGAASNNLLKVAATGAVVYDLYVLGRG